MGFLILVSLLGLQDPDVDALLKQLTDDAIEVRDKAAATLIELGEKAEAKVKARMQSAEGELKQVCKRILERIAVPKKLRGVLPPLRKVTLEAKDRNLKEVIEDLKQQTGLAVDWTGDGDVTVSVKDVTPFEALEAICKAANLSYAIDRFFSGRGQVMAGGPAGPRMGPEG